MYKKTAKRDKKGKILQQVNLITNLYLYKIAT